MIVYLGDEYDRKNKRPIEFTNAIEMKEKKMFVIECQFDAFDSACANHDTEKLWRSTNWLVNNIGSVSDFAFDLVQ